MKFGGIQKTSLIDYPGKVSCVLFTMGCNFACPYCHNPQLVKCSEAPEGRFDETWCETFLKSRTGFLDGVVVSGGEPTLNGSLASFFRRVKDMGYAVKLDTNGSRPAVISRLLSDKLVDYIAMDIKTDPSGYDMLGSDRGLTDAVVESIGLILDAGIPYEFRTTCVKPLVDASVISAISEMINGCRLYALQRFRSGSVLRPEFFENHPTEYTPQDLEKFKTIADKWVRRCIIR